MRGRLQVIDKGFLKKLAPSNTLICDIAHNPSAGLAISNYLNTLGKNNKIKAIIPGHFAGLAVDMKIINYFAEKYNLFVLEDAAHALETISNVGKVGSTNFAAAFSFYANKNITTGGEGGALATNDKKLADNSKLKNVVELEFSELFTRGGDINLKYLKLYQNISLHI